MTAGKAPSPQRIALASVGAAATLVAIKLVVGLLSNSLGVLAEAIHSATDLAAAMLTLFAVRVARRPADRDHPYGHGKAEHLSALGEGAILIGASIAIVIESVYRLAGHGPRVETRWYTFAVLLVVIAIDATRSYASHQGAHRHTSAALSANALHFTLDLVGSVAVLIGLLLVRAGYANADSIAALLVAGLALFSAVRLMRRSVYVLMDTSDDVAERKARGAIEAIPDILSLRRLRMREVAGRHFADIVVSVPSDADLSYGHAVASAVELAIERELPGSDVVVHIEPDGEASPVTRAPRPASAQLVVQLGPNATRAEAEALAARMQAEHPEVTGVTVRGEPFRVEPD